MRLQTSLDIRKRTSDARFPLLQKMVNDCRSSSGYRMSFNPVKASSGSRMTNYPGICHLVSNSSTSLVLYQDVERPGSLSPTASNMTLDVFYCHDAIVMMRAAIWASMAAPRSVCATKMGSGASWTSRRSEKISRHSSMASAVEGSGLCASRK